MDTVGAPDVTAVITALWRRAHMLLDKEPHVFEDDVGFRLANIPDVLEAAGFPAGEGWLDHPAMRARPWRAPVVARARFVEDLVVERVGTGVAQFVILGAGLDTFALRHAEVDDGPLVFEVDQPATQRWKQARLRSLGLPVPRSLRFASFDLESGGSWVAAVVGVGFDPSQPAVVASTGLTQYVTEDTVRRTMRDVARLARSTTYVTTFILPLEVVDPRDRGLVAMTAQISGTRGTPWLSSFTPDQFLRLAEDSALRDATIISHVALTDRYFSGRRDALRPCSGEHLLIASV
jgi:methyltransferase (TIGR00027 family)